MRSNGSGRERNRTEFVPEMRTRGRSGDEEDGGGVSERKEGCAE